MQSKSAVPIDELYRSYRPYLFGIAYRILGSVTDAEDLVQDVFVTMQSANMDEIRNVRAYLGKWITNRCLNLLKSARKLREIYVGPWLPEPLILSEHSPLSSVERDEYLSYAFLVILEQLKPVERIVFILREAMEFEYVEIADILGITVANCRQIFSRARKKVRLRGSKSKGDSLQSLNEKTERFLAAFVNGNIEELTELLTEDVIIRTDGGGKVRAAINPIYHRHRVLVFLNALQTRGRGETVSRVVDVNGEPGILFVDEHGVKAVVCFEWDENRERIRNIYAVMNPEKLVSISPSVVQQH